MPEIGPIFKLQALWLSAFMSGPDVLLLTWGRSILIVIAYTWNFAY